MCSAPNVYMFVYTLIGAQIVPLIHHENQSGILYDQINGILCCASEQTSSPLN